MVTFTRLLAKLGFSLVIHEIEHNCNHAHGQLHSEFSQTHKVGCIDIKVVRTPIRVFPKLHKVGIVGTVGNKGLHRNSKENLS